MNTDLKIPATETEAEKMGRGGVFAPPGTPSSLADVQNQAAAAYHGVKKKDRFITEEDLIGGLMGPLQLIIIQPRYTTAKYVAAFGSCSGGFPELVDALTSGDSELERVSHLFNTSWYPIGYADTIHEAIDNAIDRINTIDPKYKREALALVHNSSEQQSWTKTAELVLTGEEW